MLFVFLPLSENDMVMAMLSVYCRRSICLCFGLVPKYISMEETGTGLVFYALVRTWGLCSVHFALVNYDSLEIIFMGF